MRCRSAHYELASRRLYRSECAPALHSMSRLRPPVDDVRAIVFDIGGILLKPVDGNLKEFRRVLHDVVDEESVATFAHDISDLVEQHMDRMSRGEEPFALETYAGRWVRFSMPRSGAKDDGGGLGADLSSPPHHLALRSPI